MVERGGIDRLLGSIVKGGPLVLMYHSVSDEFTGGMSVALFSEQMDVLKRQFHPVSLEDIVRYINGEKSLPGNSISVTFDDGFKDNLTNAMPILSRHGIPFTVFVTTDFMGKRIMSYPPQFAPQEALSTLEIRKMADHPLCEIGGHTVSHSVLTEVSLGQAIDEMGRCKGILEGITEKPVRFFAYPKCACNPELIDAARNCGYQGAVGGAHQFVNGKSDPFDIPRLGPSLRLNGKYLFPLRLKGGFYVIDWIRSLLDVRR